ncbi:hypothetical protein [Alicyclobacillus sendaiensis]|uniref:Uncharacterized protein n=1 Tax=Alicyclobacillus sendaiensis PA2 TaxID=3029425 RepID=A0ABT6Y1Q4_ALISE|nr:hypothetical protein [Alicyclobacillus sendaiensis]MDI9261258.1 hypothetical protein [Alicyclobacillus sendaiensis PA2]
MDEVAHNQTSRESSGDDKKGNWVEDVAKIAGDISAGAAGVSLLTMWAPPLSAAADVVSGTSGFIALVADAYLAIRGEQSGRVAALDAVALLPAAGLLKEGAELAEQLRIENVIHPMQYASKNFSDISTDKEWKMIGKTYQEIVGATISVIISVPSTDNEAHERREGKKGSLS